MEQQFNFNNELLGKIARNSNSTIEEAQQSVMDAFDLNCTYSPQFLIKHMSRGKF